MRAERRKYWLGKFPASPKVDSVYLNAVVLLRVNVCGAPFI